MKYLLHIPALLLLFIPFRAGAYNLRRISSHDGLSNSSVTCFFQDERRFLWIGTYDGLNLYDGRNIHTFKPDITDQNTLSNNVVYAIADGGPGYMWVSTKLGLNKFDLYRNLVVECYGEFNGDCTIAADSRGNLFVLGHKGLLSVYDRENKTFLHFPIDPDIQSTKVEGSMVVDGEGVIWIVYAGKLYKYKATQEPGEKLSVLPLRSFEHSAYIDKVYYTSGRIVIVDARGDIFELKGWKKNLLTNIYALGKLNGTVASVLLDGDDIFLGFLRSGVVFLDSRKNYEAQTIRIDCGIYSLWKDHEQDIVWIGSNGQGVYAFTKDEYTFTNLPLWQLPVEKKDPLRALYADGEGTLWIGTKNNGIIRVRDYRSREYGPHNVYHYHRSNGILNNTINALSYSPGGKVLWVGSDDGLNYYDYNKARMCDFTASIPEPDIIRSVQSIVPVGDSLLWVGARSQLLKVRLKERGDGIMTDSVVSYSFDFKTQQVVDQIFSLYMESDSILWLGVKGNGAVRFNMETGSSTSFSFDEGGISPMNDVLCVHRDPAGRLWFGTSYGIVSLTLAPGGIYDFENINENHGLRNNSIHGITDAGAGKLWLSTNAGLILYDPPTGTSRHFNNKTGITTVEYCDHAYFLDTKDSISLFGGVDGLTWIEKSEGTLTSYVPEIHFTGVRIFNREHNIHDYLKAGGQGKRLELSHRQNYFSVRFVATDFLNGETGTYSYKLGNFSNVWMDTRANEAGFTNISPGDYTLYVRFNDGKGDQMPVGSLDIRILPPWYMTTASRSVFAIAGLCLLSGGFIYARGKYRVRKIAVSRQLTEKYKEEMYESKLRFFTNVTHEFCTPLSLIYGPCERILQSDETSPSIRKYAMVIKANAARLNSLIQEVIDFRRMETGNYTYTICHRRIGKIIGEISGWYSELAERNRIDFRVEYEPDLAWNTDENCFVKILNNLISNAFKYTPQGGLITVSARIEGSNLILYVHNTGPGIPEEQLRGIFDRYTVLDNITENAVKGLSSRNGLGLAICRSMVEQLQGTIRAESRENEYTRFTVELPYLKADVVRSENEPEGAAKEAGPEPGTVIPGLPGTGSKPNILVIDDNREMLWMLRDILQEDYTVWTAENGEQGLEMVRDITPDLIVTDIMMPGLDGVSLTRRIKEDKHLSQVPLVILSARNTDEDKIAGMESGADVYLTKPFDIQYLQTVVKKLLEKRRKIEDYFQSPESAFSFSGGQLVSREDREFMDRVLSVVAENMDNSDFTPDLLADSMQVGIRKLYRKFTDLNLAPPKEFIKECRINYAARLLLTTEMTVEEIMYNCGFSNRSHFYKEFSKRMKQAPREYRKTRFVR